MADGLNESAAVIWLLDPLVKFLACARRRNLRRTRNIRGHVPASPQTGTV
jgi:hypothetical protein